MITRRGLAIIEGGSPDPCAGATDRGERGVQGLLRDRVPACGYLEIGLIGGICDIGVRRSATGAQADHGEAYRDEERQPPDEASVGAEGPVRQRSDLHDFAVAVKYAA